MSGLAGAAKTFASQAQAASAPGAAPNPPAAITPAPKAAAPQGKPADGEVTLAGGIGRTAQLAIEKIKALGANPTEVVQGMFQEIIRRADEGLKQKAEAFAAEAAAKAAAEKPIEASSPAPENKEPEVRA